MLFRSHAVLVSDSLYEKTFVELIGLNIHDNGSAIPTPPLGAAGGILTSSADNLIERCWVHDNRGVAIELYTNEDVEVDATRSTDRTVIRSNRIHDHPEGGMLISGGAEVLVYNNLVYRGGSAITVWWESTDVRLFNNTIHDLPVGDATGIRLYPSSSNTVVRNNLVYLPNQMGLELQDDGAPGTIAEDNFFDDPSFVAPGGGDFHLKAGSPAIDSGATLPEVEDDFDGVKRPQGNRYDIGAFEAR